MTKTSVASNTILGSSFVNTVEAGYSGDFYQLKSLSGLTGIIRTYDIIDNSIDFADFLAPFSQKQSAWFFHEHFNSKFLGCKGKLTTKIPRYIFALEA